MSHKNSLSCLLILFFTLSPVCYSKVKTSNESIREFASTVVINRDASIDVTEKITAFAEQDKIRHGITRWLPTHYMDSYGVTHNTHYHVRAILINDQPAIYHTEKSNQGLKIYIGKRDTILAPGLYTYTLQYHINDAVNFLQSQDEFYWNMTSNTWDFPVDKVIATIQLPSGTQMLQHTAFTGKMGNPSSNYLVTFPSPNQITFTTTKAILHGEALIAGVSWPKGIIQKPGPIMQFQHKIQEINWINLALEILLVLLTGYLIARYYYGRNLPKRADEH